MYLDGGSMQCVEPSKFWPIAEQLAIEMYLEHGFDPRQPANPVELARRLLGDAEPIFDAPWLRSGHAALFKLRERYRIAIKPGIPVERSMFALCHELAHVIFHRIDFREEPVENACDCLAACLMSPRPAIHRLIREWGRDPAAIAASAISTQTWASMRVGEALSVPVLFYDETREKLRPRGGAEQLRLFKDPERLHAATHGKLIVPGLKKVRLRDGAGRYAFIAK